MHIIVKYPSFLNIILLKNLTLAKGDQNVRGVVVSIMDGGGLMIKILQSVCMNR